MIVFVAIGFAVAAASGALVRAELGRRLNHKTVLPLGTLLVNVSGSFALGLVIGLAPQLKTIVGTGFLGAYTTVSSFARDVGALLTGRRYIAAATYVVMSGVLAVTAASVALLVSNAF